MAKLHFYYSAMNAGKTTTLLQSSYNYYERGLKTLLFKPRIDDRVQGNKIASRIGLEAEAILFDKNFDFLDYLANNEHDIACILVDEAQFMTKNQVTQLAKITDVYDIPVLTYGLRTDFRGEPFEASQYLLAWAEKLIELKTICHCGRKATMTTRVDEHGLPIHRGKQVEIGGNDRYIAVCRKHFFNHKKQDMAKAA